MSELRVIGIDPGPVPGIVLLDFEDPGLAAPVLFRAEALQCTHGLAAELVESLLLERTLPSLVQVERFVVGRRSGRSSVAQAGEVTRDLVGAFGRVVQLYGHTTTGAGARLLERNAGQVKPWATDTRLEAAGLLDVTKGMRHARDAARHALYAAVHDGGIPDPLSKNNATWRTT